MRHRVCLNLLLLILTAVRFSAQEPSSYVGTWTGSWEGAGTGGFELTLEKAKEGGLTGRVSVTGEPTYKANLKTVSFDGAKMTATYDFPPDEHLEVLLVATFEGGKATGTWTARAKDGGAELASGTWTVTKVRVGQIRALLRSGQSTDAHGLGRVNTAAGAQATLTVSALGPFGPRPPSNVTAWPSRRSSKRTPAQAEL